MPYKKNCHNSRTSDDINMKLNQKFDKKNKKVSKRFDDNAMSASCGVIVIFPICGQLGAIWKPNSGCIVCKTYIFISGNLLSYKT